MVLTRSSLVVAFTVLALGALSGIADAQVSVEVLPLPRHPFPQLGQSRQSLPIGISRDGRFVSGNGFESRSIFFGYEYPIAWQYDRATGQLSYPGEEPAAETGLPFLPNMSEFVQVSRSGQAGVVGDGGSWNRVWARGSGHTRIVAGTASEFGDVYAVSSNGRTAIGEVINSVTHDWSVVWHDGVWQRPAGPDPYEHSVLLSDDGSTFTNELNQIYRFGDGWTTPAYPTEWQDRINLSQISVDGRRVAGSVWLGGENFSSFVWSSAAGFGMLPPEVSTYDLSANSDLTTFVRGRYLWNQSTGLLDVGALVEASGQLPLGWTFLGVGGVSDDGTVLSAAARDATSGYYRTLVVTIPAPGALATFAAAGLIASRRRRSAPQTAWLGDIQ